MSEFLVMFIQEFCRATFLCAHGELNWLGWVMMAFLTYAALVFVMAMYELFVDIFLPAD